MTVGDMPVHIAVEGDHDAEIAKRVLQYLGLSYTEPIVVAHGKGNLDRQLRGYNNAAFHAPWLVLRDLDLEPCALQLRGKLLERPAPLMRLRIVVRAAEAWLLADEEAICEFLQVKRHLLRERPEQIRDPKTALVNLARSSKNRAIVADIVPGPRESSKVGRGYTARVLEFTVNHWRPEVAAAHCDSLRRCIEALRSWT